MVEVEIRRESAMMDYVNMTTLSASPTALSDNGEDSVFYVNTKEVGNIISSKSGSKKGSKQKSKYSFDQFDDTDASNYFILSHDSTDSSNCECPGYVNMNAPPNSNYDVSPSNYINVPNTGNIKPTVDEPRSQGLPRLLEVNNGRSSLNYTDLFLSKNSSETSSLRSSSMSSLAHSHISYVSIDVNATEALNRSLSEHVPQTPRSSSEGDQPTKTKKKKLKSKKNKLWMCFPVGKLGL